MIRTQSPLILIGLATLSTTPWVLATTAGEAATIHRSATFYMFVLVASLLILFFVVIALSAAMRMARRFRATSISDERPKPQHQANPESGEGDESVDPWAEAGRRFVNPGKGEDI